MAWNAKEAAGGCNRSDAGEQSPLPSCLSDLWKEQEELRIVGGQEVLRIN